MFKILISSFFSAGVLKSNLEFGFNILVDEDIIDIQDRIIMYNFENHSRKEILRGQGYFKEFCKSDYNIKIYNKAKQYKIKQNILRVELKNYQK